MCCLPIVMHAEPLTVARIFNAPDLSGPHLLNPKVSPDGKLSVVAQGFRNPIAIRCEKDINLCFVVELAKDGSGASGTMELRPGAKDSVGKLKGQTPKVGGFEFYVCPSGYLPMDDTGKVVAKPHTTFKCKPKPE